VDDLEWIEKMRSASVLGYEPKNTKQFTKSTVNLLRNTSDGLRKDNTEWMKRKSKTENIFSERDFGKVYRYKNVTKNSSSELLNVESGIVFGASQR
jgi:uncharacterized protein (UPF0303 family)